ncbi:Rieske 2Fe-2S domain-containing protein [Pontibaca salina]|uniref:Aromatic ring-hydroxylating dioxygenase subunit alpha n=1 Tax=Pontibaca salina TaxID=2795731 RepID=A0A934HV61_9RHOB|nr:aromatic ring-hydroxylating dioxygenase subunit alpha [Pontibaca salina]MBI6630848.1 aromatic ring-hydroxylating dioxygenase subunit alpha [Pontibaca salina]
MEIAQTKSLSEMFVGNFRGYSQTETAGIDEELARVGPGTPAGEYLRRFWHPVYLTAELGELPKAIKILGEELVVFRYAGGQKFGLVHKYCPHRRASLEYGKCEDNGIRCCYHGWLFAPDGEILETPAENSNAADMVREKTRLGAYPVIEFNGLIFAYMGPPEKQPEFPFYDAFAIPDMVTTPYQAPYTCNWIQVMDAILDPVHTSFLHGQNSRPQFSEGMSELGELKFYERNENHFLGSSTRRIGDNIWTRVNELILPNFTQAGSAFAADGTEQRYFGRSCFTRWVVPVDDENSIVYAWANFGERGDPLEYNTKEGCELIEQGEILDRSPEEKQRYPADSEAVEGMGPISTHKGEHLMPTDRGISLYRRRARKQVRDLVSEGIEPPQPVHPQGLSVRTYGQDTVLRMPPLEGQDDREYLIRTGEKILEAQFSAEALDDAARDAEIVEKLKEIEAEGVR